jgi:hypothetical protein
VPREGVTEPAGHLQTAGAIDAIPELTRGFRFQNNDAPAVSGRRVVHLLLPVALFADLVADEATDRCTADSSDRAAARKDGTPDGTDAGTDRSAFVSRRHRLTTTQAEQ